MHLAVTRLDSLLNNSGSNAVAPFFRFFCGIKTRPTVRFHTIRQGPIHPGSTFS